MQAVNRTGPFWDHPVRDAELALFTKRRSCNCDTPIPIPSQPQQAQLDPAVLVTVLLNIARRLLAGDESRVPG